MSTVDFTDRAVVVTGACGGIGRAIASRFAREGATVIAGDLDQASGEQLISELGERVQFHRLDVTDEDCWRSVLAVADDGVGPIAALVNCAGTIDRSSILDQDPSAFRRVLDVNLYGPWLGMHVLGASISEARGVIVNISSTAGIMGMVDLGAYVASKFGVRGLTKAAALEFAAAGVRVCSVHPGPISTAMAAAVTPERIQRQPIARFGEPDEVAAMVWFIASEATYSTGSEFVIDGGTLLGSP